MIITAIKSGKRNTVSIYADNKYLANLELDTFVKSHLKQGSYIDEEILDELIYNSNKNKAKEKALNLLSYRSHSKKELQDKIKLKLGDDSANYASDKMEELGLIDDEKFAKDYAHMLKTRKNYSKKLIRYKLLQKGISDELTQEVIESMSFNERTGILNIIEKKYHGVISDDKSYKKAIRYLCAMGYSMSDVRSVLNEFYKCL